MRAKLTIAILAILTAACGGGSNVSSSVESPAELHRLMRDKGINCTRYDAADDDGPDFGIVSKEATCRFDDEDIELAVYKDSGERRQAAALAKGFGCEVGKAFGMTEFTSIYGDNWSVTPQSRTTARAIHAKLGGDLNTIKCAES